MTKQEAIEWVKNTNDDDATEDGAEQAFAALYDREPIDKDRAEGLWSHCCAFFC